jgi:hypothetical protein
LNRRTALSAECVRALFDYDSVTGLLRWCVARRRIRVGRVAGSVRKDGYRVVRVDGLNYLSSRIIFLWMTGRWPDPQVDHIDIDPTNNRWPNLREATPPQNMANTSLREDKG